MLNYEDRLDGVFKALGDSARRAMLERLGRGEATLSELAEPLAMSLPAVHQHLAVLEAAGLVACDKRGRSRWCRLEKAAFDYAEAWIVDRKMLWERRLDALAVHLESPRGRRKKKRS